MTHWNRGHQLSFWTASPWPARTSQVLKQIKRDGIQELVIIPLYPHYSISTSASSLKIIKAIFEK